jgi:hypothetical protein
MKGMNCMNLIKKTESRISCLGIVTNIGLIKSTVDSRRVSKNL